MGALNREQKYQATGRRIVVPMPFIRRVGDFPDQSESGRPRVWMDVFSIPLVMLSTSPAAMDAFAPLLELVDVPPPTRVLVELGTVNRVTFPVGLAPWLPREDAVVRWGLVELGQPILMLDFRNVAVPTADELKEAVRVFAGRCLDARQAQLRAAAQVMERATAEQLNKLLRESGRSRRTVQRWLRVLRSSHRDDVLAGRLSVHAAEGLLVEERRRA